MSNPVRLHPFCVGNVVSDQKAAKVVQGLHDLVELGKKAQSALRALERDGFHDGEIPYLESKYDGAQEGGRNKYARIEYVRLPKILPHSREDVPRLADCEVLLGDVRESQVKGVTYQQAVFKVRIHAVEQMDQHGGYRPVVVEQRFGEIRFNKRTLAYVDMNDEAYRLYRVPHASPNGLEAHKRLADLMSEAFVRIPEKQHPSKATQKTCDLRRSVRDWLLEEKVVHRLFEEVFNLHVVKEVLEA